MEKNNAKPEKEVKKLKDLSGLKISLCQMSVVPGRPDLNARYVIDEIESAAERGIDIIVFPEMCLTGYIVGDIFEDECFIEDVYQWNRKIVEATKNGVTAVFGSVIPPLKFGGAVDLESVGEDGRPRKHNAAIIARNGSILKRVVKSLQPNYRFFNDDKHFYSSRKIAEESASGLAGLLGLVPVETRIGTVMTGVTVCEDMWYKNYAFNPTKILAEKGAEIIVNISASPWTWRKNRKRHQIVKDLLAECRVPLVYVNNTGAQNTGKNVIVFDGSSAVYDRSGEIVFEVPPYGRGSRDFTFGPDQKPVEPKPENDTEELYNALACATRSMVPDGVKVIVGLSGGIDSAVVCAHLADVLGPERVLAVNMPMPSLNSRETQELARTVAENLGVAYEVMPIGGIVEAICVETGVRAGTLAYQNVQARARKEVLAAKAQQIGAFFVCCSNKTEIALSYGTLYGDIAGFYAPLGDMIKREVRQIADHLNRVRFKKEVIPAVCISQTPTAELAENQTDPFDYGDLGRRGYHDEMIRAFVEFRKNPEWFLEMYLKGRLESELLLEPGTLARLFPAAGDFVRDLRRWWTAFQNSFFKRVQCPPIPIFSKRAFGRDLEESLMTPHFTQRCRYLEKYLVSGADPQQKKIAVYGGSFNPPALHHKLIVERLAGMFDLVVIVPCGIRSEKPSTVLASPAHRKAMTALTFRGMPKVELDFSDLDNGVFTPTYLLEERYAGRFPDAELWFAVGGDIVAGGRDNTSEIQRLWIRGKEIWRRLNFVVISQPGLPVDWADLPPSATVLEIEIILGRSTVIRERLARGGSIDGLVEPEVLRYIAENGLY